MKVIKSEVSIAKLKGQLYVISQTGDDMCYECYKYEDIFKEGFFAIGLSYLDIDYLKLYATKIEEEKDCISFLLENPHFIKGVLDQEDLIIKLIDHISDDESYLRSYISGSDNLSLNIQKKLFDTGDIEVICDLANSKTTDVSLLFKISELKVDNERFINSSLLSNPSLPKELQIHYAKNGNEEDKSRLLWNDSLCVEAQLVLIDDLTIWSECNLSCISNINYEVQVLLIDKLDHNKLCYLASLKTLKPAIIDKLRSLNDKKINSLLDENY